MEKELTKKAFSDFIDKDKISKSVGSINKLEQFNVVLENFRKDGINTVLYLVENESIFEGFKRSVDNLLYLSNDAFKEQAIRIVYEISDIENPLAYAIKLLEKKSFFEGSSFLKSNITVESFRDDASSMIGIFLHHDSKNDEANVFFKDKGNCVKFLDMFIEEFYKKVEN